MHVQTCDMTQAIPSNDTHLSFLREALDQARCSPPKPTNFRVGCVLVSYPGSSSGSSSTTTTATLQPKVLSTGYTLELSGNTHAEQCALAKLAAAHNVAESELPTILTPSLNVTLYTTLEPCGKRLSGNTPCVQRIIATRQGNPAGGVRKVIFGAKEPGTFVQDSQSCRLMTEAGVEWEYIPGLDREILTVAMEGHETPQHTEGGEAGTRRASESSRGEQRGTNIDDITPEERRRQEALPRNPKKRMMEVEVNGNR